MIFVVSAVGTDLAESLILPGLVVELAETLAISEILLSRKCILLNRILKEVCLKALHYSRFRLIWIWKL